MRSWKTIFIVLVEVEITKKTFVDISYDKLNINNCYSYNSYTFCCVEFSTNINSLLKVLESLNTLVIIILLIVSDKWVNA